MTNPMDGKRFLYFDGGMGTLLQSMGLEGGERPETWNERYPERIRGVHEQYLAAGCNVVTTNTFGATKAHLGDAAAALMKAGVRIAKQAVKNAGHGYVAADMGSIGKLLAPYGDMPFEDAVSQFRAAFDAALSEQPDMLLIETMTDLLETRACVIAAKEAMEAANVQLPLYVSLTFDERGRLLTGADIQGTAAMLEGLRVSAIGLNCGHEPRALLENVRTLLSLTSLPVFVQPNASLPIVKNGKTIFPTDPQMFAKDMCEIAAMGAWGLGGCCGTTPEHIAALISATSGIVPIKREISPRCVVSGRSRSVELGVRPVMIGERLNPTGKKRMKQALMEHDMDYLLREAIAQCDAGADLLDVNVGLPQIDEAGMLRDAVNAVQTVCELPLQLDTADAHALENAIRGYAGKPLINSVCAKQHVMDEVFPIAAKYGGALVALTLDENGIPETVEGRIALAKKIIAEAEKYGIGKHELLFDALTMTVATDAQAANTTLETIRVLHSELQVKTVLGVSNVSFGLPQRPLLTASFIAMAIHNGLDAAIMNPNDAMCSALFDAASAVSGRDDGFTRYLQRHSGDMPTLGASPSAGAANAAVAVESQATDGCDALQAAIRRGICDSASGEARALLTGGSDPLSVIEKQIMPALTYVGEAYERGTFFLPQLLQSASAAQAAFDVIREAMPAQKADEGKRVVLATVQGDVHDIGKNIVKVLLQNYGFSVVDLGKDVPPERVVKAARECGAKLIGLSALMTTTVNAMKQTIELAHAALPGVRVMVGGAVLTADFAAQIGADYYGKDAMASVRIAQELLSNKP